MAVQRVSGGSLVDFQPMSPEQIERTMQFLLQQQAQFAADFEKLSAKTDKIGEAIIGLTAIVGHVTEHVDQLTKAQIATDQQMKDTDQRLKDLERVMREQNAEQREHTRTVESNLNVVIQMFERHLREDHGHGQRPS
jgi:septal ring factor EnvC (AmiA/AmiB activator)